MYVIANKYYHKNRGPQVDGLNNLKYMNLKFYFLYYMYDIISGALNLNLINGQLIYNVNYFACETKILKKKQYHYI